MKTKLLILIIGLVLSSQLAAQPARLENNMDELIHKLQPLSKEGPISDQQILTALQDQGLGFVSPAEIHKLKHLLRQDSPRGIIERQLRRLSADNYFPDHESNRSLRNSVPITKANGQPLTAAEQNAITQVLEDFQVNENVGRCDHYDPAVAMDASGNFVVTWCDERNGRSDIYAQRYNSDGSKQGWNFKVNDDPWVYKQYKPAIAMDASGNFVITWIGCSGKDIYAQRFDKFGNKQGVNFMVSKGGWPYNPSIAIDDNGNFIIVWECIYGNGSYHDIYAQRFDKDGNALGENFRVNDYTGKNQKCEPCVSVDVDGAGNFVIAWEDDRNGNEDIYAQRYDKNGNKQGVNFRVNSDVGNSDQSHPGVGMDRNGNFVICWSDRNTAKIYAQRYESNGNILGVNFQVNDRGWCYEPAITVDGTGRFVIAWNDNYNYSSGLGYDIYAQCYDKDGNKQGGNFLVNDEGNTSAQFDPSIAINGSGNFIITWLDTRNGYEDIYGQRYSNFGSKQGVNFRVTDDEGSTNQNYAKIAVDESGVFVITWEDERNNIYRYTKDRDIYAQRYSSDGNRQGQNFRVNDDIGSSDQAYPAIAMDGSGNSIITWQDERNGNSDIYAQRYSSDGNRQGQNFRVNDDLGSSGQAYSAIAMDSSGNFIITWVDGRNGNSDIYAQRYSSDGNRQGQNFRVNDDLGSSYQAYPAIAMDGSGNFIITWQDERNGNPDIYAQRYRSDGGKEGINFLVNDDGGNKYQDSPTIGADGSGNFLIAWADDRKGNNIYAQRYNADGSKQGLNFQVNDNDPTRKHGSPSLDFDNSGNFVIAWVTFFFSGDRDIYAQRYDHSGNPIGVNYRVNNDTGNLLQDNPDVKLVNGKIYYTWEDNRVEGQGWDIFARVDLFSQSVFTLKRKLPDGTYEEFQVDKHGWPFGNAETRPQSPYNGDFIMWPEYWWSQFDYTSIFNLGMLILPFTFPSPSPLDPPLPQDFPDWPLFVETYGKDQCYYNDFGTYRGKAVSMWYSIYKPIRDGGGWSGSCYGFAVSCFMAFKDPIKFYTHDKFKGVGQFNNLCDLDINDGRRKVINSLFLHQFGEEQQSYKDNEINKNPKQIVDEIINMFNTDSRELKALYLINMRNSSSHAVNPYKVVQKNIDLWEIYIYDSNYPKQTDRKIRVYDDRGNWKWSYELMPDTIWGGDRGLFLTPEIDTYYITPTVKPPTVSNNQSLIERNNKSDSKRNNYITFYNSISCNIEIEAMNGETIGYNDSVAFNNLGSGIPIIPATSKFHPPIGYFVPDGHYSITVNDFTDSLFYFSIFCDSIIYKYKRDDAVLYQTEKLTYNQGLDVFNKDNSEKIVNLEALIINEQSDKVCQILNAALFPHDSVRINTISHDRFSLTNYGQNKNYSVNILYFSFDQQSIFKHDDIDLANNTNHVISANWNNLGNEPVKIFVDENIDGVMDDTLFIDNQYTGIKEISQNISSAPTKYELMQNYPNPFNATTHIQFALPKASHVKIDIYSILGQHVAELLNENMSAGSYTIRFDGSDLASGIYLYRIQTEEFSEVKKMALMK